MVNLWPSQLMSLLQSYSLWTETDLTFDRKTGIYNEFLAKATSLALVWTIIDLTFDLQTGIYDEFMVKTTKLAFVSGLKQI